MAPDAPITLFPEDVEPIEIQDEMERSFIEYSMSVIISRALPDARDGLKPVHRRILYSMFAEGLRPERPYVKCSKVVGDVMGKFHPHGDAAIYDALARMVQDFSLRHPLIDGHGNFGSPDPSLGPAAARYTECKLAPISMELMAGIDENTVDFEPNYDGTENQPTVLPSRFPNLLVNGSQGIAVGMATNIPPHNLKEVLDATVYLIDNPDATPEKLMDFVKGPDFPTGAQILGRSGIRDAYLTGRGSVKLRAVAEIEEVKGNSRIVISELPYQTSVEQISKKIDELVKDKIVDGIRDVQDDSAGRKVRLVVELKRDANALVVLNNLYKHTPLQTSFGVNTLALVDGVPRVLNLAQALTAYVDHQVEVVTRRSEYRLKKAKDRAHIVEGLLSCIDRLDAVIHLIRSSDDRSAARTGLMSAPFSFSEIQANHILDMTLGRLTRLGRSELEAEFEQLQKTISELEEILGDPLKLRAVLKDELGAIKEKFSEARRTQIVADPGAFEQEDLIEDEPVVVMLTRSGYIKSVSDNSFKTQGRGGRGVMGAKVKEEDLVTHVIQTTTHAYLLVFTSKGKVYRIRAHEIPMFERSARGTAIVNLLALESEESVAAILDTRSFPEDSDLVFVTSSGLVKRTAFGEYDKSRKEGLIAIGLRENDELVKVIIAKSGDELAMFSKGGMGIRFSIDDVRATGRNSMGVRGMRLKSADVVVSAEVVGVGDNVLFVTSKGFGKRTKVSAFPQQGRGGAGVRAIRTTEQRGTLVAALVVREEEEILVVTSQAVTIRLSAGEISIQGRDATGVKTINLGPDQEVSAVALTPAHNDDGA